MIGRHIFVCCRCQYSSQRVNWSSTTTVHGRGALGFESLSGYEQMVTKPTHIDGGVLDLLLTDARDLVEVPIDSLIETSDYSAHFVDDVLEQPILHLV